MVTHNKNTHQLFKLTPVQDSGPNAKLVKDSRDSLPNDKQAIADDESDDDSDSDT